MTKLFDCAQYYYWQVQLIEPDDPDDDRYVLLYGEEGEVAGPFTVALAQAWIDRFSRGMARVHGQNSLRTKDFVAVRP